MNIELVKAEDSHLRVLFEGRTAEDDRLMGFYPGDIDSFETFSYYHRYGTAILKDGSTAGCIDYYRKELGWWVLPAFRKQGISTIAVGQFIQSRYELEDEVWAASYTHNVASMKLIKNLGFKLNYEAGLEQEGKHIHVFSKKLPAPTGGWA